MTVTLRFLDEEHEPVEEWVLVADSTAGLEDQDRLLREVEAIGRLSGEPLYVLRVNENKVSWGADGGTLNVVLDTIRDVANEAAWGTLGAIGALIAGNTRERLKGNAMSDAEVEEGALLRLEDRHGLQRSDLTLTGISAKPGEAQATFDCPTRHRRYTVTITQDMPWVTRYRIAWEATSAT